MVQQAVILAAGSGTRLGSRSEKMPKGFLTFDETTLIERSLQLIHQAGIRDILIGTGHCAEWYERLSARAAGVKCVMNKNFSSSGSLETLCVLEEKICGDFLLFESDILFERRAVDVLMRQGKSDVLLASGKTSSGDEVYVEADRQENLLNLTKDKSILSEPFGELVGITRLSLDTYREICRWCREEAGRPTALHYEDALVAVCGKMPIAVEKIPDLLWGEVDTEGHYDRLVASVMPKIREIECAGRN